MCASSFLFVEALYFFFYLKYLKFVCLSTGCGRGRYARHRAHAEVRVQLVSVVFFFPSAMWVPEG